MWGIGKKQETREERKQFISHILVNHPEEAVKLGVQDYTFNPQELTVDIHNFPRDSPPLIKVEGLVTGLRTYLSKKQYSFEYEFLSYEGFIILNEDFPLYFYNLRTNEEVPDLRLEERMLESGRNFPLTMTGRLVKPSNTGCPYILMPLVLELGDYISPAPKTN